MARFSRIARIIISKIDRISRGSLLRWIHAQTSVRSTRHKHSHGKRAGRTIMFTAETIFADASRDGPMRRKK